MIVKLELPYPPKSLSPNAREHWGTLATDKATYKNAVYTIARNKRQLTSSTFPLKAPVTVVLTFVLPDKRRRDWDNALASFKTGLDGIVEAGLLRDDSMEEIRIGMEYELGKKAAIRVTLEGAP